MQNFFKILALFVVVAMSTSTFAIGEVKGGVKGDASAKPLVKLPKSSPATPPAGMFPDTLDYANYSYVKFLKGTEKPDLTDDEFYDAAGRVIFPVNKYYIPKTDSLIMQLEREVIPLINRDSLELVYLMIRGAASPEGPYRFNKYLGEHRAAALIQFLKERINKPFNDNMFDLDIDIEDYRTLCIMMRRSGDKDYTVVQALCDMYLPKKQVQKLKYELQHTRQGILWRRLFRQYFPRLRAARVIFFFREPRTYMKDVLPEITMSETSALATDTVAVPPMYSDSTIQPVVPEVPEVLRLRIPRREVLSVKSNLLFDFAYMPGYDRWCPIPNVAVEYYPLRGHFTFGASFDCPWWQHYHQYKFFQIRNYQLETRYYFRSGSISKNPPGEGAAFRGLYLQAYAHLGLFGICFDADHGWVGEGLGGGLGVGYVLPLSRKGHWRLEFGLQVGYFGCKYDPYQYENPVDETMHDDLYYYKYKGDPDLFKKRQYRFTWIGPTRIGVTLSYDLLYRRIAKKGISFFNSEIVEQ